MESLHPSILGEKAKKSIPGPFLRAKKVGIFFSNKRRGKKPVLTGAAPELRRFSSPSPYKENFGRVFSQKQSREISTQLHTILQQHLDLPTNYS